MSELVLDDGSARLVLSVWDDAPPDKPEYHVPFAVDAVFDVCGLKGGIGTILLNAEEAVASLRAMHRDGEGAVLVKSLGSEPDLQLQFELKKNGELKVLATITPGRNCQLTFHINLDQSYLDDIALGLRDLRE
jgi:hypothetical protein